MEVYSSFKSDLHKAASLHFDALLSDQKDVLLKTFRLLDKDGNGAISQAELAHGFETASMSKAASSMGSIFSLLDKDGNGSLDLQECKALLFISSTYPSCDICNTLILDNLSFSCKECLGVAGTTFDLCLKCYPARATLHPRDHVFAPRNQILHNAVQNLLKQAQCVICGDFHTKDSSAYLQGEAKMHMVRKGDKYVCEWCSSWLCTRCGKFHEDISGAFPGRWLKKIYHCTPCGKTGTKTDYTGLLKAIEKSHIMKECSTCKIKANNGTLWTVMTDSTSTSTDDVAKAGSKSLDAAATTLEAVSSTAEVVNIATNSDLISNSSDIITAVALATSCTIV